MNVAPFSSLSSAVSGRLRFLFITVPYRQSFSSPYLSLVLSISLALPTSLHSCMNKIPAVACRGIHFYTQPKGERERETDDDGNGYKGKKQGQEELGHIISVCVCVCVCRSMYLYSCACSFVCFICGSAKHRE